MKRSSVFTLALLFVFTSVTACGKPAPKDTTGRYSLSDKGEAIINDVTFNTDYVTSDNNRVMYEIFVNSFSDSDGDGRGDIRGIINRIDYLNDGDPDSGKSLGVEGLWLTPIFKSASSHKYDVTDFYQIDPLFGTEEDLWELVELCHERNMIVILDLPINHTAVSNKMFQNFVSAHQKNETENKYYNYYSWIKSGEPASFGRTYTMILGSEDCYECNFSTSMPELNFDCDDVRKEVVSIAKHYLDLGVDGFRFDAAKYVYFGDNAKSVEFWTWYIAELKKIKSDVYTVAEVWDNDSVVSMYYPVLDCFDFTGSGVSGVISATAKGGDVTRYTKYVQSFIKTNAGSRTSALYMPFITNHDMDRAAGFLTVASKDAYMAASIYLLTPGSPFIYYGEEIGLKGTRGGENTDANRRLAMFWGDDDTITNMSDSTYPISKQTNGSVEDQKGDGDSLLSHYKKVIQIRKANPEIARGTYTSLAITNSELGGFISEWKGQKVCVLHNPSYTESLSVDLSTVTDAVFEKITAVIGVNSAELKGTTITLGPQTSAVLR